MTEHAATDRHFVVMGVTSSGKSTVAEALARALGSAYIEGDALHGEHNITKMSRGEALTDDDRWPWLQRVAHALEHAGPSSVASCSALCRRYRDCLRVNSHAPIAFIHLHGSPDVIAKRMQARTDHFMPPSLLASQLALLEPLEPDEHGVAVDVSSPFDAVLEHALAFVNASLSSQTQGRNT